MNSSAATSSTQVSEKVGKSLPRRKWDEKEERTLIDGLKELCANGCRADNGTFRHGYLAQLERYMLERHPTSGIKGEPHVNSKLRAWKRNYGSISLLKSRSGLGFDYSDGAIIVDDPKFWEDFIKIDPNARGMNTKKWPLFKHWEEIFGKDRATGEFAEGPLDAVDEIEKSQVHGISNTNNMSWEFPYVVDDEDEADARQETTEPTREAECAHLASQNAYGGTQQAENDSSGPSAFPEASQGVDGVTQRGQNQGTNFQTSSSKANEKEKSRKRKKTTEEDEKCLDSLMNIMKQFGEKQDTRMGTLVDKLGDRDHFEMRDEVLAIFKSPAFQVFTAAQQIKASIWLTDDVKRMQIFLNRSELDRQTMVWLIINGEI